MNKVQFVSSVYNTLRDNDVRKSVPLKKAVFHISDDDGNVADFAIKQENKRVLFTTEDITSIIDACMLVVEDALKHGEDVSIRGFGTIGVHKRAPRYVKQVGTGDWVPVEGRYVPKFTSGESLRLAARLYDEVRADDGDGPTMPPPLEDDEEDEEVDE